MNMNFNFDQDSNALYIRFNNSKVMYSKEASSGVICDFDDSNKLVGIEILAVQQRTPEELENINSI